MLLINSMLPKKRKLLSKKLIFISIELVFRHKLEPMASQNKLPPNEFLRLPDELLLYITKFMKIKNLVLFIKTCHHFHSLIGNIEWIEYHKTRDYNLTQLLIGACKTGNIKLCERLIIKEHIDLSVKPDTAITWASYGGHIEIVKLLLADERVQPDDDAFFGAIEYGHIEIVELLLADERVDPYQYDDISIDIALRNGHTEIAKLLLADKRTRCSLKTRSLAAKHGYLDIFKLVLSKEERDPCDTGAIGEAAKNGHLEIVKLILDGDHDDLLYSYSIGEAAKNGYTKIVELLLDDGRCDPTTGGNSAIREATENGRTRIVELLLSDKRVDPTVFNNEAIHLAVKNGHTKIVKLLLSDKRVDPSDNNNNMIRDAVKNGRLAIFKLLLADRRVNTSIDNCEIKQLAEQCYLKLVKLLTEHIDPSDRNNCVGQLILRFGILGLDDPKIASPEIIKLLLGNNNFAVRLAVYFDHLNIMTLLDNRHDGPLKINKYAMRWADENGHSDIIKLLCDRKVNSPVDTNLSIQLADHFGYSGIIKLLDDRQINSITSKDRNVIGE